MTLPFKEEVVNDTEYSKYNFEHSRFIGYLNKYGEVLNYSRPLGIGGHDDNKLTTYFEQYFRMPAHILEKDVINLKSEKWVAQDLRKYFKEQLKYIAYSAKEFEIYRDPFDQFRRDLYIFFYRCYQADTFMDGFGQNCMSLNELEFYGRFCTGSKFQRESYETEEQYNERSNFFFEDDYYWYKKHLMLDWYKTVIIQYMGYHLVERCKKGITTCDLKPYETFYNYLLNDFTIHQIPHMIYDNNKKMYIPYEQNQFLVPDSELRLKDEIQAIKKLVPLNERSKYYR